METVVFIVSHYYLKLSHYLQLSSIMEEQKQATDADFYQLPDTNNPPSYNNHDIIQINGGRVVVVYQFLYWVSCFQSGATLSRIFFNLFKQKDLLKKGDDYVATLG